MHPARRNTACVFNNCATLFSSACPIGECQTQFLPRDSSGDLCPRDAARAAGWVCVEFRRKGGVTTWQKKPLRKPLQPRKPLRSQPPNQPRKPLPSPLRRLLSSQPRKPLSNQPQKPLPSLLRRKPLSNQPRSQPSKLLRNQPRKLLPSPLRRKPLSNQPRKPLLSQPPRKLQLRSKLGENTRVFARVFFYDPTQAVN